MDCRPWSKELKNMLIPLQMETEKKKEDLESASQSSGEKSYSKKRIFVAIHLAVLQQFVGINSVVGYGSEIVGQIIP